MSVPAVLSDPVVDVVAAVEKLRADDRLITQPEMLLCDVEALLESITGLQGVLVRRLREAHHADASTELYGRSTKRWLIEDQCLPAAEAARYVRLLHYLPDRTATEAAFDAAEINAGHVCAILTALATLPPHIRDTVEPHLIERARLYPPEEIAGFVDQLLDGLGLDNVSDARRERRHAQRGVDTNATLHGARSLSGTLTAEVGGQLEQALSLAGADLPADPQDQRSRRQRRHDALGVIAAAYLAANAAASFEGAPRTMIVTIDLDALENRLREAWITLPDGATISAATARRLACDAQLIPVVLGGPGDVVDVGQAGREFTSATRRAAFLRDGGACAFPDCRNPVSELHHVVFRRHGGPATLTNAAWLCAYHHWLVHEGGWTLHRTAENAYLWTGPHGHQRIRHLETA